MPHPVEQHHHRQQRHRQGQNDLEEHPEVRSAVNLGGLLQLIGNGLEGRAHNDQVPGGDQAGDDQRPAGIQHTQVFH
ncbi:hypothetical protein D3C81_1983820 [compost metagenome]